MPKKILVTGGAGFVGTNLIKLLISKTNHNIISLDDYSSGLKKNHIKSKRIKYIKAKTVDIDKIIKKPNKIDSIFHFGEFARIYQSFKKFDECYKNICDLSLGEKQTHIDELKHELGIYTNKKEWVKQITKLYK